MSKEDRRSTIIKGLLEEKEQDLPENSRIGDLEVVKTAPLE